MANLQTFPIRATFCSKLFREKKIDSIFFLEPVFLPPSPIYKNFIIFNFVGASIFFVNL